MKVLSFDQSTSLTAYCLMDSITKEILDYGYKEFDHENIDTRISEVKKYVNKIVKKTKAEVFALEDIQFQNNYKVYRVLAELLGTLKNNFHDKKYLYIVITPTQWKGYSGIKGRKREEQKKNTIAFIKRKYGIDVIEDIADAIGICIYACREVNKIDKKN